MSNRQTMICGPWYQRFPQFRAKEAWKLRHSSYPAQPVILPLFPSLPHLDEDLLSFISSLSLPSSFMPYAGHSPFRLHNPSNPFTPQPRPPQDLRLAYIALQEASTVRTGVGRRSTLARRSMRCRSVEFVMLRGWVGEGWVVGSGAGRGRG